MEYDLRGRSRIQPLSANGPAALTYKEQSAIKAHKTQKSQTVLWHKCFTKWVIILLVLRSCFFHVNFVPSVANCRF
jgi:hypothetical protein